MPALSTETPLGTVTLFEADGALVALDWGGSEKDGTPLLNEAKAQLAAYFSHDLTEFDLPLAPNVSETQKRFCHALSSIPFGETLTYGEIAGKTGTVENFTRIDGERVQLTDHSIFVAFAPVKNPKIALAVYIEHGYYGGRYAGHIASLLVEKYLKGEITRKDLEKKMLEKTLEHEYAKPLSGEPFKINEYVW